MADRDTTILLTREGKATKITGKQALLIRDAVRKALTHKEINAKDLVNNDGIHIVDLSAPINFSYVETALIALLSGKNTADEIAESIIQRRKPFF